MRQVLRRNETRTFILCGPQKNPGNGKPPEKFREVAEFHFPESVDTLYELMISMPVVIFETGEKIGHKENKLKYCIDSWTRFLKIISHIL